MSYYCDLGNNDNSNVMQDCTPATCRRNCCSSCLRMFKDFSPFYRGCYLSEDSSNDTVSQKCCQVLSTIGSQIPGIFVATCFAILDNVPYGFLIFPKNYKHLAPLGATMVIFSASIAQAILACVSVFPYGAGAFISENVPLLHTMSSAVAAQLEAAGKLQMVISTMLVCFFLSSVVTGVSYLVIGTFKLGNVSNYIPKEVLLGYLMGMGTFIVTAGIGVATDIAWSWTLHDIAAQFRFSSVIKWSLPVMIELLLLYLERKRISTYTVPYVLASVPILFYCIIFYFGVSIETARATGWIFDTYNVYGKGQPSLENEVKGFANNFNLYQHVNFGLVDWSVVFGQILTIITIAFFSVLHAPINVPSLSLTTKLHSDLNHEMNVHGLANFLCGITGGLQCYMTYSTSVLLKECGLAYRWASLLVAFVTCLFVGLGPEIVLSFFPRPAAAIFLIHIGVLLLSDSVVIPYAELDTMEYAAVWIIGLIMQADFMKGAAAGLFLSFCLFVLRASHANTIHASISGGGLRSKKIRRPEEMELLKEPMESSLHIAKLQGSLFFGNAQNFHNWLERIMHNEEQLNYLIVDFSQVTEIDCTGVDKLAAVVRLAVDHSIVLICSGMNKRVMQRTSCWSNIELLQEGLEHRRCSCVVQNSPKHCLDTLRHDEHSDREEVKIRFFVDLEDALLWVEESVLKDGRKVCSDRHIASNAINAKIILESKNAHLSKEFDVFEVETQPVIENHLLPEMNETQIKEHKIAIGEMKSSAQYHHKLVSLLASYIEEPVPVLNKLARYFVWRQCVAGDVLWRTGDSAQFAVIVQSGLLAVPTLDSPLSKIIKKDMCGQSQRSVSSPIYSTSSNDRFGIRKRLSKTFGTCNTVLNGDLIFPSGLEYVVIVHPVWNERILIHKNHFDEYFEAGQMAGEIGLLAKERRVNSLVVLEPSKIWCLTAEAVKQLLENEPNLLCIMQSLAIRGASHRLCYLLLHGSNFSI